MNNLYEYSDILNTPYETFFIDTQKKDFRVRPHFHPYVEMVYMIEGKLLAASDEKEYLLSEGDMLLLFRDSVHSFEESTLEGARFTGIKFDSARLTVNTSFTPRIRTMLAAARGQDARTYFRSEESRQQGFEELFFDFVRELENKELGYDIEVHAKLCILMTRLIRIWQAEGIDFTNVSDYISREELSLQNIIEYIDMHIDENPKVEDLAARCHMSYSHFARSFKEMYGRSCKEHLEMLRIERAEELLKFTELSLNEVSLELGYADQSHFTRAFKKHKGVTPGSIR